ncbi:MULTISPECIES: thioesterase family protein [unclassified Microbacterium]|uniref:thioesterase family protein n=1 Tax=unclassified Microbacterium TaxID=2609290 RepID=UPI0012F9348B|nr:thioesterase family protein [Microbacterium sp. MAH-37]MVQ43551.1 thioesterase family protein [Microbacterium sp. MAH-37]
MTAYFERLSETAFRATRATEGAWNVAEQHIAPTFGLLAHLIQLEHASRHEHPLALAKVTYDILGVIPIDVVEVQVRVLRPGRTIELIEATLSHDGRPAAIGRAWFLKPHETADVAGSALPAMPARDGMPKWDAPGWPGAFVRTPDIRRIEEFPGRAHAWVLPLLPLIEGEQVSATARMLGYVDLANGLTPRVSPSEVAFPNLDLSAHLLREPVGDWIGFDTTMSIGPAGLGITHTVLHDEEGPVGTSVQELTIRPLRAPSGS